VDVFQAMRELRAMRRLKPDPVPHDLIREVVEYATYAPTASNGQNWRFVVVTDPALRQPIAGYYQQAVEQYVGRASGPPPHQARDAWERQRRAVLWQARHLAELPVLIFPCLIVPPRTDLTQTQRHSSVNGSIWPAIQNLLLACRAKGLGATATTLHLVYEEPVNTLLGLPADARSFAMIPVGWPLGKFGPVRRRPVDEVLAWNGWA
jgi:nitroreductase